MKKQKSNLWERIKICWNVLTLENYVYFGLGKNPIKWNKDGTFNGLNKDKFSSFSCISYKYKFEINGNEKNLHDFMWSVIENFAKDAQNGKY